MLTKKAEAASSAGIADETIKKCDELVAAAEKTSLQLKKRASSKISKAAAKIKKSKDLSAQEISAVLEELAVELKK